LGKVGRNSFDLWDKDVVNHVASVEDISVGGVNLLLESDDLPIVVVGAAVEVLNKLGEFVIQVLNKFVDGVKELLKGALAVKVDFGVADEP